MPKENYISEVKEQYQEMPFPPRDAENEKTALITTVYDSLDLINHYCFEGKQDFNNKFSILVAGCGTGDAVIYLAEQLRNKDAHVTCIDLSQPSLDICKERAKVRKLKNITYINDSLLNLPDLDLGEFDYINCSGVLHHLKDPKKGLKALADVLKEDGVMGIMLYGKHGRAPVYPIQEVLRIINKDEEDTSQKVANCRTIVDSLPPSNAYYHLNGGKGDHKRFGDAGYYDLFLHSNDIPFSVPDIYKLLKSSKMKLVEFLAKNGLAKRAYCPSNYIADQAILQDMLQRNKQTRQTVAELLSGAMTKHSFYASKKVCKLPKPSNLDNIPFISADYCVSKKGRPEQVYKAVYDAIKNVTSSNVGLLHAGVKLAFRKTEHTNEIFQFMDGKRSLREIFDKIKEDDKVATYKKLTEEFAIIYDGLNYFDILLLRDKSIEPFDDILDMQIRVAEFHGITAQ